MTTSTDERQSAIRGPFAPRRRSLVALAALYPLALALPPTMLARSAAARTDPEAFVSAISEQVLEILQQTQASDAEKLAALKKLLDSHTDLDLVARLVLGRHWRSASEQDREDYVALFRQILMNTMADRMGDYDGQSFEIAGSTELSDRDTAVQTRIIRNGGAPPLSVDWRIREHNGSFAIIDVIAEGVSLVVSQRNEVASIIERRGMTGLLETMRERSDQGETAL